jgi:hypothetical protein
MSEPPGTFMYAAVVAPPLSILGRILLVLGLGETASRIRLKLTGDPILCSNFQASSENHRTSKRNTCPIVIIPTYGIFQSTSRGDHQPPASTPLPPKKRK